MNFKKKKGLLNTINEVFEREQSIIFENKSYFNIIYFLNSMKSFYN
jgi:hypothetical protein